MNNINFEKEVTIAYERIKDYIYHTPLVKAQALSHLLNAEVFLKLENVQLTSSFKIRGAFNKLLSMDSQERDQGIVAASMGNHGAAVAFAGRKLTMTVKIFVPEQTVTTKIDSMKLFGAEVVLSGRDCLDSEMNAKRYASEHQQQFVSPYNDLDVIFGQGTIGVEILQDSNDIDEIYVSVGGGGLISGISGYVKALNNHIKVVGCLPKNSPVMAECIKAGKIVEMENLTTLSDGTAGNIEAGSVTLDFCQRYVDQYSLVTEEEIAEAMRLFLFKEHLLVEGAAAVPLASLIKNKDKIQHKKIVIIVCGANVSEDVLSKVICKK